jgi:hypothetical protein
MLRAFRPGLARDDAKVYWSYFGPGAAILRSPVVMVIIPIAHGVL